MSIDFQLLTNIRSLLLNSWPVTVTLDYALHASLAARSGLICILSRENRRYFYFLYLFKKKKEKKVTSDELANI